MKRRAKGTGTIEKTDEDPPRFRARFPFRTDERTDVGVFNTWEDADTRLDAILEEQHARAAGTGRNTLKLIGSKLLDLREREGYRSIASDRDLWNGRIASSELALEPIESITTGAARQWLASLTREDGKPLATSTKKNTRNLLNAVFEYAVEEGWLETNPVATVKIKSRGETRETSTRLTKQEALALLVASDLSLAIVLALFTGQRSSELGALQWTDLGDTHMVVRYGSPNKPRKNGRIHRVPLLEPMLAIRPALLAACDDVQARRLERAKKRKETSPAPSMYVLPSPTGHHRPKGQLVELADWRAWLAKAGIARPVRWHDLRHTCATLCLNGGMTGTPWSYEAVKDLLGHSSVKVTERYARSLGLADAAANVHTAPIRKPGDKPGDDRPLVVQVVDLIRRRGWDSNPRMTVLQTFGAVNGGEDMGALPGLVRAYSDLAGHLDRERSIWDAYDAFELAEMRSEELH